jgi:hypothetical protein
MAREWAELLGKVQAAPNIETALEITIAELILGWEHATYRDERKAAAMVLQLGQDSEELITAILNHKEVFKPIPPVTRSETSVAPKVAVRPVLPIVPRPSPPPPAIQPRGMLPSTPTQPVKPVSIQQLKPTPSVQTPPVIQPVKPGMITVSVSKK